MRADVVQPRQLTDGVYALEFPVGNVYLWAWADGLTLVDTGVPGSADAIAAAIESLGHAPHAVREIVLTHFHRDHTGSAAELARRTGARVLAHAADAAVIGGQAPPPRPMLTELERPLAEMLFGDVAQLPGPQPAAVEVDRVVQDGDRTLGGGTIIAVPGHTPGSIAVHVPHVGVIFTGDSVASYDGAPILGPFNIDRLGAIDALRKQARLDFDVACVGHGQPIVGHAGRKLLAMIRSL
jgi:glyoxylase-like metal-dependent hydrolase (beta-lactamase superfamily II)